jgi:hypothetical protein
MNGQGGRQNRPGRQNPQAENRFQTQSAPGTIADVTPKTWTVY